MQDCSHGEGAAGVLNVGTINVGSSQNLSAQLFKSMAGVDMAVVPFRTSPDAMTALLRKDVDLVIDGYVAARALMDGWQARALATSGPRRGSADCLTFRPSPRAGCRAST